MLTKKLFRDIKSSMLQFVSMILLCMLGTFVFSGLDSAWRLIDRSNETYFKEHNLATFWIQTPNISKQTFRRLCNMEGVSDVQERFVVTLETTLKNKPDLKLYGYDSEIRINTVKLLSGTMLTKNDLRGCLIEDVFATANELKVGDEISFDGFPLHFIIRGIVIAPEQIMTSKDVAAANPHEYGFGIVNRDALPTIPSTEYIIQVENGTNIEALKKQLELDDPQAFVLGQDAISAIVRAREDAIMFENLSYVFPLLAFAVSSLILLTTLTRMIENQRVQFGTLRSLGYPNYKIALHYLSYGLFPSLIGSAFGLWFGRWLISGMIWTMVDSNMNLPPKLPAPISVLTWFVFGLSIVLSLGVCYFVYRKSANETTASLLRPKPPKEGTRTLLEFFPAIWNRLSFNGKMIVRNMFRNKLRTIMTLVGILCCTMLMITTLGLQETIKYNVKKYYEDVVLYDMSVQLTYGKASPLSAYKGRIDADVVDGEMVRGVVLNGANEQRDGALYVLSNGHSLLNLGKDYSHMVLPDYGVVMTEKLCTTLGLDKGDILNLRLPGDDETIQIPIVERAYSNLGQGVYMSENAWNKLRKGKFIPTALQIKGASEQGLQTIDLLDEIDEIKYPDKLYLENTKILEAVTNIFTLMGVAAFGLAFVICYNMGILNLFERKREYATLKVLGYHGKEIKKLMIKESNIVAFMGVLLGIFPGIWLTDIIMVMCETETTMYPAHVGIITILIACGSSYFFSRFVQWILTRNIPKIDMVSSLKSVE